MHGYGISLGTSCVAHTMLQRAGFSNQPRFPFDDIFSSLAIVNHCLEDAFATFLDASDYLPSVNDQSWGQRRFREEYGQQHTFAHHDMRDPGNQAKFARRVERFLALGPSDRLFFTVIGWSREIDPEEVLRLRCNLTHRFGECPLLLVSLNEPEPGRLAALGDQDPGLIARSHRTRTEESGVEFRDPDDNEAVTRIVADAAARTGH